MDHLYSEKKEEEEKKNELAVSSRLTGHLRDESFQIWC